MNDEINLLGRIIIRVLFLIFVTATGCVSSGLVPSDWMSVYSSAHLLPFSAEH